MSDELIKTVRERWYTKTGLFEALVLGASTTIGIFLKFSFASLSLLQWAIVALVLTIIAAVWSRSRFPHVKRGKVGFGVAILDEDSLPSKHLCSDFVLALRDCVKHTRFRHEFEFVQLPSRIATEITDVKTATDLMRRSNFHFVIYGRVRTRNMPGGLAHVIDLHGAVRHVPLDRDRQELFGREFSETLPSRFIIGADQPLLTCEFAAVHVGLVAKYIIGIAAALSSDPVFAEELLLSCENQLKALVEAPTGTPPGVLLGRVRARITELYRAWLAGILNLYTRTRTLQTLEEAETLIAKLKAYEPHNYLARSAAAMCAFVLRRDLETAWKEVEACRGEPDATWRYSEAFLHAYAGNLDEAYRSYSKAFAMPLGDPTVPAQCEEFLELVMRDEPEKKWLFFCLGLINYRAKGDLEAAQRDLSSFIDGVDPVRFPAQVGAARKWLTEMKSPKP